MPIVNVPEFHPADPDRVTVKCWKRGRCPTCQQATAESELLWMEKVGPVTTAPAVLEIRGRRLELNHALLGGDVLNLWTDP